MAPHNPSQLATTDDSFQRASKRILKVVGDHPQASRAALLGLVLAVVASTGGLWLSRYQARQAGYALVQAFALKDAAVAGAEAKPLSRASHSRQDDGDDDGDDAQDDGDDDDDETMDALHDDTLPQFADASARDGAAAQAFAALAHAHPGALGTLAALEAAALAHDDATAGPVLLAQAAAKLPADNSLLPIAALRQAQLAEDAGDADAALHAYGRIVAAQIRFLGDEAQLQRARLLMDKGDLNAAREALEDVQNNYPQSHMADEMRIQMAALDAKLGAQAPQAPALAGASAG